MEERRREERYERPVRGEEREEYYEEDRPRRVERYEDDRDRERYDVRERRVRPVEREYRREPEPYGLAAGRIVRLPDMIRWGAIWAGMISAFATMISLGVLGLAVGLAAAPTANPNQLGTSSAIWGIVVALVSFFVGGWLAGRTSSFRGTFAGFIMGSVFWSLSLVLVTLLTAIGVGGVLGAVLGTFGNLNLNITPGTVGTAQNVAIGTFIGLVVTYAVAVFGGILGAKAHMREYDDTYSMER